VLGTVLFLLLAALLVSSFWARMRIANERRKLVGGDAPVSILVAREEIPAGVPLAGAMIGEHPVPQRHVQEGAIYPEETQQIVGRRLARSLLPGDPLLWEDLLPPEP